MACPKESCAGATSYNQIMGIELNHAEQYETAAAAPYKGRAAAPNLPQPLRALLDAVEPAPVCAVMTDVCYGLWQILTYLQAAEQSLHGGHGRDRATLLFKLVHEKARSLLVYLQTRAPRAGGATPQLIAVLDGVTFALQHELGRVFDGELMASPAGQPAPRFRAEGLRAHGLLANCFQQSLVTLAQVFDPALTGAELFSDYRRRQEQSFVLYEELWRLSRLVRRAEAERGLHTYYALVKELKTFRAGCLHYLMYRDWAEFEGFIERITDVKSAVELAPVLHQFACYLEALIAHVRLRAVLQEHAGLLKDAQG